MRISNLEATVAITSALGHPARLRVVAMLQGGELCACQITEVLGLASSTVSAHLKELKRARLLIERKDGRWVYYGLSKDAFARSWIETSLASVADDAQMLADSKTVAFMRTMPVADLCRLGYEEAKARMAAASATEGRS